MRVRHRGPQDLLADAAYFRVPDARVVRVRLEAAHHHELGAPFYVVAPLTDAHAKALWHPPFPPLEPGLEEALERQLRQPPRVRELFRRRVAPVEPAAREAWVPRRVQ